MTRSRARAEWHACSNAAAQNHAGFPSAKLSPTCVSHGGRARAVSRKLVPQQSVLAWKHNQMSLFWCTDHAYGRSTLQDISRASISPMQNDCSCNLALEQFLQCSHRCRGWQLDDWSVQTDVPDEDVCQGHWPAACKRMPHIRST